MSKKKHSELQPGELIEIKNNKILARYVQNLNKQINANKEAIQSLAYSNTAMKKDMFTAVRECLPELKECIFSINCDGELPAIEIIRKKLDHDKLITDN